MSRILQWKYTSCKFNIEQSHGFYTFSHSEGITPEEKEELVETLGSYTAPDHLPYQPKPTELLLFPVAFSFFRLESGRYVIARTAAVGQDYGGSRWGNFFSHALILEDGIWPLRPIELCIDANFSKGLSETEIDLGKVPEPLSILPLNTLKRSSAYTGQKLYDYIYRNGDPAFSRELLDTVISGSGGGLNIVLTGLRIEIPAQIAIVQQSITVELSHAVPFITYVHNPLNTKKFLISGTSDEGSAFDFDSIASARLAETFDFSRPERRRTKKEPSPYSFDVLPETPPPLDSIQMKLEFVKKLEQKTLDFSLDSISVLRRFAFEGIVPEDEKTFSGALELARNRLHVSYLEEILLALSKIEPKLSPSSAETLLRFVLNVIDESDRDFSIRGYCPLRSSAASISCTIIRKLSRENTFKGIQEMFRFIEEKFKDENQSRTYLAWECFRNVNPAESKEEPNVEDQTMFVAFGLYVLLHTNDSDIRKYTTDLLTNEFSIQPDSIYFEYRRKLFPILAELVEKPEQHRSLLQVFARGKTDSLFLKAYLKAFLAKGCEEWKNGRKGDPSASSFLEFYLGSSKIGDTSIASELRSALADLVFDKFSKKQTEAFEMQANEIVRTNPKGKAELDSLMNFIGSRGGVPFWMKITILSFVLLIIVLSSILLYLYVFSASN